MIPNPEYLALANSLTFSIAVSSPASLPIEPRTYTEDTGGRSRYRTIYRQLLLLPIDTRFIPRFSRSTYRLVPVYRHLYTSLVIATKMTKNEQSGKEDNEEEERHELMRHRESGEL
jgi:hypothetical protein